MPTSFLALAAGLLLAQVSTPPITGDQAAPPPEQPATNPSVDAGQPAAPPTAAAGADAGQPAAPPAAAAPTAAEQQEARERAIQAEQTMQSIDQRLSDLNQQAAAAQQLREEMADIARTNVNIRDAAQQRVAAYNFALQELYAVDADMALTGASGQQDRLEALRQSLLATRNDADASAGQQETVSLDKALTNIAAAEASLADSDYFSARNNLYYSRQQLQIAVSAAGSAITVK